MPVTSGCLACAVVRPFAADVAQSLALQLEQQFNVSFGQDLRHLHRLHPVRAGVPSRCTGNGALGRL